MFYSLFLLLGADLIGEFRLDNRRMFLNGLDYNRVYLERDGSILGGTKYHFWHWDRNGRLIQRLGGKGQGPGEFEYIGQVHWTGRYYWVIDGKNLPSSIYDAEGNFLFRKSLYFRQFVRCGERLFVIDTGEFRYEKRNKPAILHEIEYEITDTDLQVRRTGLSFKKITERQYALQINFKLAWLVADGDRFLAVDQLEPRIHIYNSATIARERRVPEGDFFEPPAMQLMLEGWVDPPRRFQKRYLNKRNFREWWMAWSRINYFSRYEDGFLLAYEMPDADHPQDSVQAVQKLDADGRRLGDPYLTEGIIVGSRGAETLVFVADDDEDFIYTIKVFAF